METKILIRMANDIGNFFKSYPNEEQAKKDMALHIQKFWGRDMRVKIKEYVTQTSENNSELERFVFNAISKYLND
ncbi:MAG: formate dehydrogenase subunit delta [Nitrosomonadales bacterium]|jgi:formate dehydrogenase subunit delta|nr:formate dehydrogenase subunit delta [Nitrosomonadales bacterium]MBT7482786.1 formate dehydrogenase subunit delta [Nitrosomonadales bacterium]